MRGKVLIVILFMAFKLIGQQDLLFTEFAYDKLGFNPAYAGAYDHTSLTLLYRNQWIGLDGAPSFFSFTSNFPALNQNIGLGLNLGKSSISIFDRLTFEGSYAYKIPIDYGTLSFGLSTSWRQFTADFSDSRLRSLTGFENDPAIDPNKFTKIVFNLGFGAYFSTDNFYIGASIPRLSKSDIDFDEVDELKSTEIRHSYIMGGGKWNISRYWELSPQLLLKLPEGVPLKFEVNLTSIYDERFHIGVNYSSGGSAEEPIESIDLILGLQYNNQIFFGFAYDFTLSSLAAYESGSLEMVANYRFVKKSRADIIINPRYY